MVPLLFLCLAMGVVYGVKKFLQIDHAIPKDKKSASGVPLAPTKKVKEIFPEEPDENSFESLTENTKTEALPVGTPAMPAISGTNEEAPPEPQSIDGGIPALKLLEDFLAMKSLDERMPHLESKRTEADLASSILNTSLPEVTKISVDIRETNSVEQMVDYYYLVDFTAEGGGINPQTMLVRIRGTSPPKVVVDPFLDLYGGRFAKYASAPVKEAGTFQVIITAGAFCYDDVPGSDKKMTLKIQAREDTKEIAKAYFGKRSKIGDMLQDETSGLGYGQAKACSVFMRWNMEEDPRNPFLEALDITSLNWNP
ncbi:MAG: hypothetical protein H7Y36_02970 [Armatimonadetes bacterium]|nr:hypothetical protein [Akkermansiaceae bacterium]